MMLTGRKYRMWGLDLQSFAPGALLVSRPPSSRSAECMPAAWRSILTRKHHFETKSLSAPTCLIPKLRRMGLAQVAQIKGDVNLVIQRGRRLRSSLAGWRLQTHQAGAPWQRALLRLGIRRVRERQTARLPPPLGFRGCQRETSNTDWSCS